MDKISMQKLYPTLYNPSRKEFSLVDVPPFTYMMIDGQGNPNTAPAYSEAVQALYATAYALKFASKRSLEKDYIVPPLEGLWWADEPQAFRAGEKESWFWTMMIMVPSWIPEPICATAIQEARDKKKLPALKLLRVELLHEGSCVQIMHLGPYDKEGPTLLRLHQEFMPQHQFEFNGKHHEIYLGDPRKAAPETLRTILRQPVKQQESQLQIPS